MSKAILEFDLSDQCERAEFEAAQRGSHYKMKIDSLYTDVFRGYFKYDTPILDGEPLSADQFHVVEAIWDKVHKHFGEEE